MFERLRPDVGKRFVVSPSHLSRQRSPAVSAGWAKGAGQGTLVDSARHRGTIQSFEGLCEKWRASLAPFILLSMGFMVSPIAQFSKLIVSLYSAVVLFVFWLFA